METDGQHAGSQDDGKLDVRWDPERYDRPPSVQLAFRAVKHRVVPRGRQDRRVLSGLARGCVLPVDLADDLRLWLGLAEVEIARYVKAFVDRNATCYDVGAHLGYYSLATARLSRGGRVFAMEPDPDRYATLEHTLAVNPHVARQIHPHRLALGSTTDDTTCRLDDFVAVDPAARAPDFVKIDVDGPEYEILQGATSVLTSARPRLIIETHGFGLEASCLGLLVDAGYIYLIVNAQRVWPERRPIEVNRWIVAVHRSDARAGVILRK